MRLSEYQMLAMCNSAVTFDGYDTPEFAALGLAGEAGEIANKLKKHWRKNRRVGAPLDEALRADLKEELGDALWYVAMLAEQAGLDLDEVAVGNIEKIRARRAALQAVG